MSSDSHHHHNQLHNQQLHNHYADYDFHNHNGLLQNRDHLHHHDLTNDCRHDLEGEMEGTGPMLSDSIIRGNMQYVNGELRKIPRPLNAFMIFSNEKRKELKKEFPGEPNNMISSRLGAAWKGLSDESRKKYHDMAHREDLEHRRKYPNYQYCPGHARKLKKARREQRLRQQGIYRASRQPGRGGPQNVQGSPSTRRKTDTTKQKSPATASASKPEACRSTIKRESTADGYPSSSRRSSTGQVVHGIAGSSASSSMPPAYGEGRYPHGGAGIISPPEGSECMLSCCGGCKPADIYCCPDSHWNTDALAASHGFNSSPYQPPMFYFSPGYDAQYPSDMMPQPCLMSGDCNGCYPAGGYMDSCYGPLYPAAGDGGMIYKDLCFVPADMTATNSPCISAPITSVGTMMIPMNEQEAELTDISNNMVPTGSQDSQTSSQHSCASKDSYSASPSTLQEISPTSPMCTGDIPEISDN